MPQREQHLKNRLIRLFETFRKPGDDKFDRTEAFRGYYEALNHLSVEEMDIAFPAAVRRAKAGFRPEPGEILEALEIERQKSPTERKRLANPECTECLGTGYRLVPVDGPVTGQHYQEAVKCECWSHAA